MDVILDVVDKVVDGVVRVVNETSAVLSIAPGTGPGSSAAARLPASADPLIVRAQTLLDQGLTAEGRSTARTKVRDLHQFCAAVTKELRAFTPTSGTAVAAHHPHRIEWFNSILPREPWAAWTNAASLVLLNTRLPLTRALFGPKASGEQATVATVLMRHEAKHVGQFIDYGGPPLFYQVMADAEKDAYAQSAQELAGHSGSLIAGATGSFRALSTLAGTAAGGSDEDSVFDAMVQKDKTDPDEVYLLPMDLGDPSTGKPKLFSFELYV